MSIINLLWEFVILLVCSFITIIGVVIEGLTKIFARMTTALEKAYERVLGWKTLKRKERNKVVISM